MEVIGDGPSTAEWEMTFDADASADGSVINRQTFFRPKQVGFVLA